MRERYKFVGRLPRPRSDDGNEVYVWLRLRPECDWMTPGVEVWADPEKFWLSGTAGQGSSND